MVLPIYSLDVANRHHDLTDIDEAERIVEAMEDGMLKQRDLNIFEMKYATSSTTSWMSLLIHVILSPRIVSESIFGSEILRLQDFPRPQTSVFQMVF